MILRGNVFSKILGIDTGITVIIPNKFKVTNKYKVAYVLHGLGGNNGNWADNSMLPVYANDYNTVFIMPEVVRSLYSDMKYGQKYFTYITEELPEICQSVFNISSKREDTAIIGGSMGGYGALKGGLSKPNQYGYICAFASACLFLKENLDNQRINGDTEEFKAMYGEQLPNDFKSIFGEELEWDSSCEILELAKKINNQAIKPKIYMCCGEEDPFKMDNRKLKDEIDKLDYEIIYEEINGNHDFYFFDEALKKSLDMLYGSN